MELRQLRYFVAVAETCHFSRAAAGLHIAQPALSQAIRQLEHELGATLLIRTTRRVSLTAAGEFFLVEIRRILESLDAGVRGVRKIADGWGGLVRLGLTGTAAHTHLPRIARTIRHSLPSIALEIHADLLTPAQCDRLRDGTLDLAVLRPPVIGDGIVARTFETEALAVALPAGHPFAVRSSVGLGELGGEEFIMYAAADSVVNSAVVRACQSAGFTPRKAHTAQGTAVLLALVAAGLGLAVLPAGVRAVPFEGAVFRDLDDVEPVELALAWRRGDDNPALTAVMTALDGELTAA
ncbi:LysR substrate-binding domain-containing protein [Amycolatopsis mongoliensis]|uniref:LysR substrate-binding domain-containing protein n=1 Tax=Amycolatopsis mongoliensis TaxID=715475 RepID=A0A9Y2JMA8_9PSEU|nr:LysR substrate-binding domain-containing protein [Amycolatopsis sp. 4-36]WIY01123.1 LysR substrate-binding domain-containing protein [Amycolatopsis sp. 4-36]